jgi:hypothetical protein
MARIGELYIATKTAAAAMLYLYEQVERGEINPKQASEEIAHLVKKINRAAK